jgi:tripartite-type tricarboxylate transporter receptor subunit TctC
VCTPFNRETALIKSTFAAAALGLALGLSAVAHAADYPAKPIHIIVPNSPGGTVDLLPRILAEKLQARLGQTIIIENRPGAAGNIAAESVFRAEPDGYTLFVSPPPALVINQSLYPKLSFDPSQFVPVTVIASVPNALLVNPTNIQAKTVAEFVAYAKAHPGKVSYASQGNGSTTHLTAEMFASMTGTQLVHVPYKGSTPALTDLLSGQVDVMFDNIGASLNHIKAGKLRALGVGSKTRAGTLPDVPPIGDTLRGFQAVTWFGVVAPPKTPAAIVDKLHAAIAEALKDPGVMARLNELSATPVGSKPAEMATFMKQDAARWKAVIQTAKVQLE